MKKIVSLLCVTFALCGFESLSDQADLFNIEVPQSTRWVVEKNGSVIKAYYPPKEIELTFYVDSFMPNSQQCLSNKRIKDIKFDVDVYKRFQKGDTNFAKMVERMKINFKGRTFNQENKVYGSNLITKNLSFKEGEIVHVGTLQFLAPYPCEYVNDMQMRITNISPQRGETLPALEWTFKIRH